MEANSPLIRENIWEWYNAVVKSRLHNDSQELIVFTRWHEEDLIGSLCRQEQVIAISAREQIEHVKPNQWVQLNYQAIKQCPPTPFDPRNFGEPLWPERHALPLLEEKHRLDPVCFESMYQGSPVVREGLLYGDAFATYEKLPKDTIKQGNYTDTADMGEDYLCSIAYAVGRDGVVYITDVVYTQAAMEETELLVVDMLQRNAIRTARIESNNGGRGFARAIGRALPHLRVEWFHQSRNKESRILSYATTVLRQVAMPHGWQLRWSQFYNDLTTYRRRYKSNRWHDAPDVLTGIIETECIPASIKKIRVM